MSLVDIWRTRLSTVAVALCPDLLIRVIYLSFSFRLLYLVATPLRWCFTTRLNTTRKKKRMALLAPPPHRRHPQQSNVTMGDLTKRANKEKRPRWTVAPTCVLVSQICVSRRKPRYFIEFHGVSSGLKRLLPGSIEFHGTITVADLNGSLSTEALEQKPDRSIVRQLSVYRVIVFFFLYLGRYYRVFTGFYWVLLGSTAPFRWLAVSCCSLNGKGAGWIIY